MLVDHADAGIDGLGRRREPNLGAVDLHATLIGGLHAVEDLHERRLAGPVLTDYRVDLTLGDPQVDPVVGHHAREPLGDPGELYSWRWR